MAQTFTVQKTKCPICDYPLYFNCSSHENCAYECSYCKTSYLIFEHTKLTYRLHNLRNGELEGLFKAIATFDKEEFLEKETLRFNRAKSCIVESSSGYSVNSFGFYDYLRADRSFADFSSKNLRQLYRVNKDGSKELLALINSHTEGCLVFLGPPVEYLTAFFLATVISYGLSTALDLSLVLMVVSGGMLVAFIKPFSSWFRRVKMAQKEISENQKVLKQIYDIERS